MYQTNKLSKNGASIDDTLKRTVQDMRHNQLMHSVILKGKN
jgi:hypothetical protein